MSRVEGVGALRRTFASSRPMRPELRGANSYGSVSSDARSSRPNDERKDAGKEAEAEQTVFAVSSEA